MTSPCGARVFTDIEITRWYKISGPYPAVFSKTPLNYSSLQIIKLNFHPYPNIKSTITSTETVGIVFLAYRFSRPTLFSCNFSSDSILHLKMFNFAEKAKVSCVLAISPWLAHLTASMQRTGKWSTISFIQATLPIDCNCNDNNKEGIELNASALIERFVGPIWSRQGPCWPHELCYLGGFVAQHPFYIEMNTTPTARIGPLHTTIYQGRN